MTGSVGTCTPVSGSPHGTRPLCAGVNAGTTCGDQCDGADTATCHVPDTTKPCSASACNAGTETHASTCDGAGSCKDVPRACPPYICGATACQTSCTTKADCSSPDAFCDSGKCLAPVATGGTCVADAACASGHCVDGTCCESACSEPCAACDVPGLAGKCVPIKGAPHGTRAPCAGGGGSDPCTQAMCDGTTTASCAAFVGSEVKCREASCAGAKASAAATCDGSGHCPADTPTGCANDLQCDAHGAACLTECVKDADCLDGYSCQKGVCAMLGDQCSADFQSIVHKDGSTASCAPYLCKSNICPTTCATTADCTNGAACDDTGHCAQTSVTSAPSSGGCSSTGRPSAGLEGLALLGATLALGRRRRTRR